VFNILSRSVTPATLHTYMHTHTIDSLIKTTNHTYIDLRNAQKVKKGYCYTHASSVSRFNRGTKKHSYFKYQCCCCVSSCRSCVLINFINTGRNIRLGTGYKGYKSSSSSAREAHSACSSAAPAPSAASPGAPAVPRPYTDAVRG